MTHPDDIEAGAAQLDRLLAGDVERAEYEQRFLHRNGSVIWALVSSSLARDAAGAPVAIVAHVLDISDRKRFEVQLRHLADHDPLTGLFNRRRFAEELDRALGHAARYGTHGAVLVLDLDGFKTVNDTAGHAVGDELIVSLAGQLRATLRTTDVLARVGGDEFAVIVHQADEAAVVEVASKLLAAVRRHGAIGPGHGSARVSASIGASLFRPGDVRTGDELLVEADIAMYEAKAAGRDRVRVHRPETRQRGPAAERTSSVERLRAAIDAERFVLYAQPIVPVCTGGVPRFELLLRLADAHGDLIRPLAFLPDAERFDLIGSIDRWVLAQAVRLLHDQRAAGHDIALAVNMSAKTVSDPAITGELARLLARDPIGDGRLVIEITETAAITNIQRARSFAQELRALGCRLALDDFGAGFASFYYLKHLDFDYLKIDGEFVRNLPTTPADRLVVRAIVEIARGLGTETVAEFVGDQATIDLLRELGVGYAQGYFTGRPGPLADRLPGPVARDVAATARA